MDAIGKTEIVNLFSQLSREDKINILAWMLSEMPNQEAERYLLNVQRAGA